MWGDTVRKGGTCKTHETHETLSMINVYDGPMETAMLMNIHVGEHSVHAIGFGQKTGEINFFCMTTQLVSAQNEKLFWLAGMN